MSDPREELREAIARAILTPDESYYSDESLFDTDWFERELALHRADCVLRAIDVNKLIDPSTWTVVEAADRIEALEAERDTLAEMVGLFDPWVTLRVAGHGPYLAHRRPAPGEHITLTPDQAERFRAVLDRIYREAETDD